MNCVASVVLLKRRRNWCPPSRSPARREFLEQDSHAFVVAHDDLARAALADQPLSLVRPPNR